MVIFLFLITAAMLTPQGEITFSREAASYTGSGSQNDQTRDVDIDASGNFYITGGTKSGGFLTTDGSQHQGSADVFVQKYGPDGTLLWSTLVGGNNYDRSYALELDHLGGLFVAGRAGQGFPTTGGSFQPQFGGDASPSNLYGSQDGFVMKLDVRTGQVQWASFFGGNDGAIVRDIAVDASGDVYLGSSSSRSNFPPSSWTANAYQRNHRGGAFDNVLARVSGDGAQVRWATYLGGSGHDHGTPSVRVDADGNVLFFAFTDSPDYLQDPADYAHDASLSPRHANGTQYPDFFITKIRPDGQDVLWGTYVGGKHKEFTETHSGAVDAQGNVYAGFTTKSTDLRATNGSSYQGGGGSNGNYPGDAFLIKLDHHGNRLHSAFVGGSSGEGLEGISVDLEGNVHFTGATYSADFPVTPDAFQPVKKNGADMFAGIMAADFSQLTYATFLGGNGEDYARSSFANLQGDFVIVGQSGSSNFPVTDGSGYGGGQQDAVMVCLQPGLAASSGPAIRILPLGGMYSNANQRVRFLIRDVSAISFLADSDGSGQYNPLSFGLFKYRRRADGIWDVRSNFTLPLTGYQQINLRVVGSRGGQNASDEQVYLPGP